MGVVEQNVSEEIKQIVHEKRLIGRMDEAAEEVHSFVGVLEFLAQKDSALIPEMQNLSVIYQELIAEMALLERRFETGEIEYATFALERDDLE